MATSLVELEREPIERMLPTTPKEQFPGLLKKAIDAMSETKENLISGFRKTGILPTDKEQPLSRLPRQDIIVNKELIGASFMKRLEENWLNICPEKQTVKKKKICVAPGKSISVADLDGQGPTNITQLPKK